MRTLKLSVFGFKNYVDEINLNILIRDTVDLLFNDKNHNSVTILFNRGSDKTARIDRICVLNGYGFQTYAPDWNNQKPIMGVVRMIKSPTSGRLYNSAAALNTNKQQVRDSDYIILLHDEYNDGYKNYEVDLYNIVRVIKSTGFDNDRVANWYYNSGTMAPTKLEHFKPEPPQPVINQFSITLEKSQELLNLKFDYDLLNNHTDERFSTMFDKMYKRTTVKKEIPFTPNFELFNSTNEKYGKQHIVKFTCIMKTFEPITETYKRKTIQFFLDIGSYIDIQKHIQLLNTKVRMGLVCDDYNYINQDGNVLNISLNNTVILFNAVLNGIKWEQAYNYNQTKIDGEKGRIVWRSSKMLALIYEWQHTHQIDYKDIPF